MSNALFPKLAGLTWDGTPVPTWSTVVQRSKNGATTRLMNDPYPLWTFDLSYEFVRGTPLQVLGGDPSNPDNYSEYWQIVGFYNARGGSFDDFLLDPGMLTGCDTEGVVTGGPVGVGDGTTTTFYLGRDGGGFLDEVQNPIGTYFVSVNGVVQVAGWTPGANGSFTFAAAPAEGAIVTWDGRWQWRVRFAESSLGVTQFMKDLFDLKSVKLEQVKL